MDDAPTEIERGITEAIQAAVDGNKDGDRTNDQMTRDIMRRLKNLGQSFNGPKLDVVERWLYDLSWSRMSAPPKAGYLLELVLAVECEWTIDLKPVITNMETVPPLNGDFQKLIQSRARHRLWIFGDTHRGRKFPDEQQVSKYIDGCVQQIERFGGTQAGDRYLLAGMYANRTKCVVRPYVVPPRGVQAK